MGEFSKEEMRERIGNIDLIRDIIFGSKLQEYDNRLDKLESWISSLEQEMRDRTEQVKTDSLAELRTAVSAIEEKLKSLNFASQKDNADLRQLLDNTYKTFTGSLESIDRTVINQTTSIRTELSETREKLQEDTRILRSQIFEELEKRFAQLTDAKLSRNDVADILFEVGLRVKKAEFAPGLKEGDSSRRADDVLLLEASRVAE